MVVYVASMCIVGFFGIQLRVYDERVKVSEVVCLVDRMANDGVTVYDTSTEEKYANYYQEGIRYYIGGKVLFSAPTYVLKFTSLPTNATDPSIYYIYDKTNTSFELTDNGDGTAIVKFLKSGTADITVKARDSSGASTKIRINVFIL